MTDEPIREADAPPKREVLTIYVAEDEDGIRLDRWFRRRWPHLSNIQVQKMARSGQIRVDGARIKPEGRLTAGAAVRVPPIPDDTSRQAGDAHTLSAKDIAFAKSLVLYEDDMVIAINKPHGLAVQGGTKTSRHVDRLLGAWGEGMDRPRLVHRLDRDTSGVLLLGKGPEAAKRLAGAFARRQAKKTYWAIVIGNPKPSAGQIDMPLKKTGINDFEMMRPADRKDPRAEPAETAFATISRAARPRWLLAFFCATGSCAKVWPNSGNHITGSKPKPLVPAGSRTISPTTRPTAISGSGSSALRSATSVETIAARRFSTPCICSSSARTLLSSPLA